MLSMNKVTVKQFSLISISILSSLLFVLSAISHQSRSIQQDIIIKEAKRFNSLALTKELAQSSDDLTRMARGYAATGDPAYKEHFSQILDIREGRIPRPYIEPSTYWHLEGIGKAPKNYTGETVALIDLMRREGLTEEELSLLQHARNLSNKLAEIEKQSFAAIEGKLDDNGIPDLKLAQQLLWGDDYVNEKAKIMVPIKQFIEILNGRTKSELGNHQTKLGETLKQEIAIISILLICIVGMMSYLWRHIQQPLSTLIEETDAIAAGNYSAHCEISRGAHEIVRLGNDFNRMAEAINRTVGQLRISEKRLLEAQQITQMGNWEYNFFTDTLFWSDQVFRIFGMTPETFETFQPSYEVFLNLIHPDDKDMVNQAHNQSMGNHGTHEIVYRILLANGNVK